METTRQSTEESGAKVASAYRTVSREAILVVSGIIPIDILAMEIRKAYIQRRGEQEPEENHSRRHWTYGRTDGKLRRNYYNIVKSIHSSHSSESIIKVLRTIYTQRLIVRFVEHDKS